MQVGDLALSNDGHIVIIIKKRKSGVINVYDVIYVTGKYIGQTRSSVNQKHLKWLNKKNKKKLDKLLLPR
tara:strand:- start:286 stop:495 length:210 start_codon:yes stop_codon:yes gene_type:complete